jgi:hypothetical protein
MIQEIAMYGIVVIAGFIAALPMLKITAHRKKGHVLAMVDTGSTVEHIWCSKVDNFLVSLKKKDKRVWIINKKEDLKINPQTKCTECFVLEQKAITHNLNDTKTISALEKAGYRSVKEVIREFFKINEDTNKIESISQTITVEGETISLPQVENLIKGYTPHSLWAYIKSEATNIALMTQPKDAAKTFLMIFLGVLLAIIIGYVIIKSNVVVSPGSVVEAVKNTTLRV